MSENQVRALEQADIIRRLEAGEELALLDVTDALSVRPRECWKLAGYEGRGRSPDPHSPLSEIPASAWPHLRWQMSEGDMVVDTPAGTRIYDVRVRYPVVATDPGQPARATLSFADATAQREPSAVAPLEPSAAFDAIVDADRSDGIPWSLDEYGRVLVAFGLSLTMQKLRVPGVTIAAGGEIERGAGPILLRNALLVRRFCLEDNRGGFTGLTRAAVGRLLVSWLTTHHPDLVTREQRLSDDFPNEIAKLLRFHGLGGERQS